MLQMRHKPFTWKPHYANRIGKQKLPVLQPNRSKVRWLFKRAAKKRPIPVRPLSPHHARMHRPPVYRSTQRRIDRRRNSKWFQRVSFWISQAILKSRRCCGFFFVRQNLFCNFDTIAELKKSRGPNVNSRKLKTAAQSQLGKGRKNKARKNSSMSATSSEQHEADYSSPNGSISRSKNPSPTPLGHYRYDNTFVATTFAIPTFTNLIRNWLQNSTPQ